MALLDVICFVPKGWCIISAFGIGPLGTELGPFGGDDLITVLGVLPESTNSVVVVFDRVPEALDTQGVTSATNETNYVVAAVDPTILPPDASEPHVPPGEVVPARFPYAGVATQDAQDPRQVVVTTESRLEPRVRYTIDISENIRGSGGEEFAGNTVFSFRGLGLPNQQFSLVEVSEDRYRDFDNVIQDQGQGLDTETQVYRFTPSGDIALSDARTSLRKRIFRRLFTDPGGFAWAPTYGSGVRLKMLVRPGMQQALADTVARQVREEPDVRDATAEVSFTNTGRGTFVFIDVWVRMADTTETRISYQEQV